MNIQMPDHCVVDPKDIDISSIDMEGIDYSDYPDFCDAFISRACWNDNMGNLSGNELSDDELDALNEHSDFVYEQVWNWIT